MPSLRGLASALSSGLALVGQQTLVVDPAGGGPFLTVAAALAAAAPGDTVFVRGGLCPGAHTVVPPLQIVGDPTLPRPVIGSITVVPGGSGGASIVFVQTTVVTLQDSAALDQVVGQFIVQAGSVVMSRCTGGNPTCQVFGGDVVLNDCSLLGRGASVWQSLFSCLPFASEPALRVSGGNVAIANSDLTGGWGVSGCTTFPIYLPPSTAILMLGGQLRTTRSVITGGQASPASAPPAAPAVTVQGGTFTFDPSTTLAGVGGAPGTPIFLPATDGRSAVGGGTITATLQTQPGLAAILIASPGRGVPIPSFAGDVWFDAANHVVLALGVTDAQGQLGASIAVPPGFHRGTAITAQGGAISPAAGTAASTPVVVHVQ